MVVSYIQAKGTTEVNLTVQVLLVVGGWGNCDPVCTFLDTTEVFTSSSGSWRLISAALPSAIQGGYVATVSNIVYMLGDIENYKIIFSYQINIQLAGGYDGTDPQDDIFQYEPDGEEWKHVGNMINARNSHAVSIVDVNNINNLYCIVKNNWQ